MSSVPIIVAMLFSLTPISNTAESSNSAYASSFFDCGVYTIHSASNPNLVWGTSESTDAISLKAYTNNDNQRFIIRRERGQSNSTRYQITPLLNQSKPISTVNKSNSTTIALEQLSESNYTYRNNTWFSFIAGENNEFKIATSYSSYKKYVTCLDSTIINNAQLCQDSLGDNATAFNWKFIKTNDLTQNSSSTLKLNDGDMMRRLRVSESTNYIIKTQKSKTDVDTVLQLSNSSGDILFLNDDYGDSIYSFLSCKLIKNTDYFINVRSKTTKANVVVSVYPKDQVYFTSYTNTNDIDTRYDMDKPRTQFNSKGYYFNHITNPLYYDFYTQTTDGKLFTEHKYFMLSSHGAENGKIRINPNETINADRLPSMEGCSLSVWAICYGGINGNAASYSVVNGCENSLGWAEVIGVSSSRYFTDRLWLYVLNGYSIDQSIRSTINNVYNLLLSTNSQSNTTAAAEDSILYPILYSQDDYTEYSPTAITTYSTTGTYTNDTVLSLDYSLYSNIMETDENEAKHLLAKNTYCSNYQFQNAELYRRTIDSYVTNEYLIHDLESDLWYISDTTIKDDDIIQYRQNNTYNINESESRLLYMMNRHLDLIEINDQDKEATSFNGLLTNSTYSEEEIINAYF